MEAIALCGLRAANFRPLEYFLFNHFCHKRIWASWYCCVLYQMLLWSGAVCLGTAVCCTRCCCEARLCVLVLLCVVPDVAVKWGCVSWYCCVLYQMLWGEAVSWYCCVLYQMLLLGEGCMSCYCCVLYQMLLLGEGCVSWYCCVLYQMLLCVLLLRTPLYLFSLAADAVWFMKYLCGAFGRGSRQPPDRHKPLPLLLLPPGTRLLDLLNWFGLRSEKRVAWCMCDLLSECLDMHCWSVWLLLNILTYSYFIPSRV
jgi:hypothetical protein